MRRMVVAWFGLAVLASVAACSSGEGNTEGARPTTTTTTTTADRAWGSPPSTTAAPDPIPWSEVVEAASAPTGRLARTDESVFPDGGNRVGGTGADEQTITFDGDRQLVEQSGVQTISGADEGVERAQTVIVYAPTGGYIAGDWVEDRCGAAAVRQDLDVDVDVLIPPNPLVPLIQVSTPDPAKVTADATTYEIDLPTDLVVPYLFIDGHPEVAEGLDHQMTPVEVTIDSSGAVTIVAVIPLATLSEAGADIGDLATVAPSAASQTTWRLDGAGEPVHIEVPTDLAADPSCAGLAAS